MRFQSRVLSLTKNAYESRIMASVSRDVTLGRSTLYSRMVPITEPIKQDDPTLDRGDIYKLLSHRPDNRCPLAWERNNIDLLLLEGNTFICPWTRGEIAEGIAYDLDH